MKLIAKSKIRSISMRWSWPFLGQSLSIHIICFFEKPLVNLYSSSTIFVSWSLYSDENNKIFKEKEPQLDISVQQTPLGGEGGIRTHVPNFFDNRISSAAQYGLFDTSPSKVHCNINFVKNQIYLKF